MITMIGMTKSLGREQRGEDDVDVGGKELELRDEARREAAHRLAEGKGVLPIERRNEQAEMRVAQEITERAQHGEHFHSSLHPA